MTHQYRDYPPVYTPFWWNWLLRYVETRQPKPVERPHGDRIFITPASPEAMEEVLWMTFFPEAHRPEISNVLDGSTSNPGFEAFYSEHIRKLLLARRGRRYASKANYNITRLEYIQRLFPDGRFVIPIREPVAHIASLIKQHRLFCEATRENPRALEHLRRVGHFEFGPIRRPINTGDSERTREVIDLWNRGDEVRGWARYWAQIYAYVADRLDHNERLRTASLIVRYEDLCERSRESLRRLFEHAGFDNSQDLIREFSEKLRFPTYYQPQFSDDELQVIAEETGCTASRFGYTRLRA